MFGSIGPWELILILAVALIVVGPGKLPEAAKSMGKAAREFKKATSGVQQQIVDAMKEEPAPPVVSAEKVHETSQASNGDFVAQIVQNDSSATGDTAPEPAEEPAKTENAN